MGQAERTRDEIELVLERAVDVKAQLDAIVHARNMNPLVILDLRMHLLPAARRRPIADEKVDHWALLRISLECRVLEAHQPETTFEGRVGARDDGRVGTKRTPARVRFAAALSCCSNEQAGYARSTCAGLTASRSPRA
eukprot:7189813-Prymnesium_polylepis.2